MASSLAQSSSKASEGGEGAETMARIQKGRPSRTPKPSETAEQIADQADDDIRIVAEKADEERSEAKAEASDLTQHRFDTERAQVDAVVAEETGRAADPTVAVGGAVADTVVSVAEGVPMPRTIWSRILRTSSSISSTDPADRLSLST